MARHGRDLGGVRGLLRLDLVAHRRDGCGIRADEHDARLRQRLRKRRALGEKAVARMHGLGACLAAGGDDLVDRRDRTAPPAAGPICTASSAISTCSASRSASEKTATVLIPMRRAVLMTRQAISPRLAIRIFLNIGPRAARCGGPTAKMPSPAPRYRTRQRSGSRAGGGRAAAIAVRPRRSRPALARAGGCGALRRAWRRREAPRRPSPPP